MSKFRVGDKVKFVRGTTYQIGVISEVWDDYGEDTIYEIVWYHKPSSSYLVSCQKQKVYKVTEINSILATEVRG